MSNRQEKRLLELSQLKSGWCRNGEAISPIALQRSGEFLREIIEDSFNVYPTPDGGVNLESYLIKQIDPTYVEINFQANGDINVAWKNRSSDHENERDFFSGTKMDIVVALAKSIIETKDV